MNINDHVHVKLTAAGARVAALAGEDPRQERWQLWHLMQVFGPEIYHGQLESYFERNQVVLEAESERDLARAELVVRSKRCDDWAADLADARDALTALQARVARAVADLTELVGHALSTDSQSHARDLALRALEALR